MLVHKLILVIAIFFSIFLAYLIYTKAQRSRANLGFVAYALFLAVWPLTLIFFMQTDFGAALFWMKSAYVAASCIAVAFWYFSLVFPDNTRLTGSQKVFMALPLLALMILLYTDNFLVRDLAYHSWGKGVTRYLWGYFIFGLHFFIFYFGGCARLWLKRKKYDGMYQRQIWYIVATVALTGIFGIFFNLVLPSPFFNNDEYIWIGPIFTLFVPVGIVYAIVCYRFLDIKIILRKSSVAVIAALLEIAIINIFVQKIGGQVSFYRSFDITALVILILVFLGAYVLTQKIFDLILRGEIIEISEIFAPRAYIDGDGKKHSIKEYCQKFKLFARQQYNISECDFLLMKDGKVIFSTRQWNSGLSHSIGLLPPQRMMSLGVVERDRSLRQMKSVLEELNTRTGKNAYMRNPTAWAYDGVCIVKLPANLPQETEKELESILLYAAQTLVHVHAFNESIENVRQRRVRLTMEK